MSLTNKLSLYISLVIIAIFCAVGTVFLRYGEDREERLVSKYATLIVENSVQKLAGEISRIENLLATSAPLVEKRIGNSAELMPLVEQIVKTDTLIMGGCIALHPGMQAKAPETMLMEYVCRDSDGSWRHKHLGDSAYDYTGMPWYTDVLRSGRAVWSEPYFDAGGGNDMMVTCSYPLHDEAGEIVAVLTADVALGTLSEEIARLRPIDDSYAFIVSAKGVIMAHPDSSLILKKDIFRYSRDTGCAHIAAIGREMLAGKKGLEHTDIAGEDVLVVYEPVEGTGWAICCVCPYKSIMSQLDLVAVKAVIFLFVGLLVTIILVRLVVLYSMKPLVRLTGAASKISDGELDVQLPSMRPSDDIGRLNNAFSEMQKSLRLQMEQLVETTKAKEHIESELHIARTIQMSLLPHCFSPFPQCDNLELYAVIRPAKEVGGDLYDFFIRDSKLFFTIGDVSGKGVPASLFMAVTRTLFRNTANRCDSPREIISAINNTVLKDNDTCMFVTMFVGVLDLTTGRLIYCNAGHNPPVLAGRGEASMCRCRENIPAGVIEDFDYEEESIVLRPGQNLFLYTDGLTEAENSALELYGSDRMLSLLARHADDSPKEIISRMETSVNDFVGGFDQSDDLTMLCLRLNGGRPPRKVFANTMQSVSVLPEYTADVAERYGLGDEVRDRINLVLEEALVNVICYAYPEGVTGEIALDAEYDAASGDLTFEISDSGRPFDPTCAASPDIDVPVEERSIGGLGIYLVRSLSDRMEYSRREDRNILKITISTKKCDET